MLEVRNLETGYSHSQIIFGLNLTIAHGEVATLLGRNGMGKTTTVNAIIGVQPWLAGEIHFRGQQVQRWSPQRIAQAGVALVPEGRRIFPNLTVRENLVAFAANRSGRADPWTLEKIYDLFPSLEEREQNLGDRLSGGQQQMLAIGRALMTNPHLLILDEATVGLAPLLRREIWSVLQRIKGEGQTILVIDKYVERLIELADHHTIIESGRVVWTGSSVELAASPELWQKYMSV
ncbi:MAG: ABC transporter ATP-binding protein [Caldilineaceae bacterium]|nr:ABC transporter ATP-binding protein [Caldilineaceae bacterium]